MTSRDNVQVAVKDGVMTIRCNLQDITPEMSKSGKSMVYASTGGARVVEVDGARFSLNLTLYQKR